MLKIGDRSSRTVRITDEQIKAFAQASGDTNPIHLDEEHAAKTRFGRRIAHGMLTASFISTILGNDMPGPGTIYLGQEIKFKAPVFIGDEIIVTVEVIKYRQDKNIATFRTTCANQDGKLVLEGEAVVITPPDGDS